MVFYYGSGSLSSFEKDGLGFVFGFIWILRLRSGFGFMGCGFVPMSGIDRPWIIDLCVLHGLGGVASYYGTLPLVYTYFLKELDSR